MLQSHTAVLERLKPMASSFETEPYETAWAREAIFFVRVHESVVPEARATSAVQISADGIAWVDEGTTFQWPTEPGVCFARVAHFGGWLRLRTEITEGCELTATIQLVLKS